MIIRPYRPEDYPAIKRNLEAAGMFDGLWDGRDNVESLVSENHSNVLVAEYEGLVVGSLFIDQFGARVAFIYRLVVDERYRNQGIAGALLEATHAELAGRGVKEVALFADDDNEMLKDFYSKKGYETGTHRYRTMWRSVGDTSMSSR